MEKQFFSWHFTLQGKRAAGKLVKAFEAHNLRARAERLSYRVDGPNACLYESNRWMVLVSNPGIESADFEIFCNRVKSELFND